MRILHVTGIDSVVCSELTCQGNRQHYRFYTILQQTNTGRHAHHLSHQIPIAVNEERAEAASLRDALLQRT